MEKHRIFISYSHHNTRWLGLDRENQGGSSRKYNLLERWKGALHNKAEFWYDRDDQDPIRGGQDFEQVILREIERASIAILLISQDFVNSPFIKSVELPAICRRVAKGELAILPIYVEGVEEEDMCELMEGSLRGRHFLPTPKPGQDLKPLLRIFENEADADEVYIHLLRELKAALKRVSSRLKPIEPEPPQPPQRPVESEPSATESAPRPEPPPETQPKATSPPQTTPSSGRFEVVEFNFASIPSGPCEIGCNLDAFNALVQRLGNQIDLSALEQPSPVRKSLPAFELAKTPVTNAQYARFVQATGWPPPTKWLGQSPPPGTEQHPVTNVSFIDACAFCEWAHVRLPDNDEWEKAARSGDARAYPWGDHFEPGHCHASESGATTTAPVGTYGPAGNVWGLSDLAGNVGEIVDSGRTIRDGAQLLHEKQIRGGAFDGMGEIYGLTWSRLCSISEDYRSDSVGFRVAASKDTALIPSLDDDRAFVRIDGQAQIGCPPRLVVELKDKYRLAQAWVDELKAYPLQSYQVFPFEMAVYPVTNRQYWEFVSSREKQGRRVERPKFWLSDPVLLSALQRLRGDSSGLAGTMPFFAWVADHPVTDVSYAQAQAFCDWLTTTFGARYRLPTRREWEVSARGHDGRLYPWGNEWKVDMCNCIEAERGGTVRVDAYPENRSPFGCVQMSGNVTEWTADVDSVRYIKGGSFLCDPEILGISFMDLKVSDDYTSGDCGFRVVRVPQ